MVDLLIPGSPSDLNTGNRIEGVTGCPSWCRPLAYLAPGVPYIHLCHYVTDSINEIINPWKSLAQQAAFAFSGKSQCEFLLTVRLLAHERNVWRNALSIGVRHSQRTPPPCSPVCHSLEIDGTDSKSAIRTCSES